MADRLDLPPLILGSASPRRADLLTSLGLAFEVQTVAIDERALVDDQADAATSVERIARAKFAAFGQAPSGQQRRLITADTLVSCGGVAMGKPDDDAHLERMLVAMSSQTLTIATAVCVGLRGAVPAVDVVSTLVTLQTLGEAQIDAYVATGVGSDKAGGLALQSEAGAFIDSVSGCWSNVLGLPVCAVAAMCDLPPVGRSRQAWCSVDVCGRRGR